MTATHDHWEVPDELWDTLPDSIKFIRVVTDKKTGEVTSITGSDTPLNLPSNPDYYYALYKRPPKLVHNGVYRITHPDETEIAMYDADTDGFWCYGIHVEPSELTEPPVLLWSEEDA